MTSCLGRGLAPTRAAFRETRSGLAPCRFETVDLDTYVGEIAGLDDIGLPPALLRFDCRNNRASELGLSQDGFSEAVAQAARRHGCDRAGVFIGTSTAGILQTELSYRRRDPVSGALPSDFDYRGTHNTFSAAEYVRTAPWLVIFPGVAISFVVFGTNLLGDALRDLLDPRGAAEAARS